MKKYLLVIAGMLNICLGHTQTIADFTSVKPQAQNEVMDLPTTHTFQALILAGDSLTAGGTMPVNADFTGYVPIGGSSRQGYLSVNSEFMPGGVTVLDIEFNATTNLWDVTASEAVDFSALGNSSVPGTATNCSGGITPWGTVVTCEENDVIGDLNNDGYDDFGWNIEIDPATRTVMDYENDNQIDKLWAHGRMKHENVVVAADSQTVYFGEDKAGTGYLYKFICDTPGNLSAGNLFVLQQQDSTGSWIQVPNTTQSDRNNTIPLSTSLGGTKFDRIEDVEIGPDNKVYFASTTQGRIFRFRDMDSTITDFEVFVENDSFLVDFGTGTSMEKFGWCDNLVFDCEGNLWVCQDGGGKHVWVVGPGHTPATPQISLFMNTPLGTEPTGITISPDCRYIFMSLQHPNSGNSQTMQDAAGNAISFGRDVTMVIARNEHLGNGVGITEGVDHNLSALSIFPNPVNDRVWVEITAENSGLAQISLVDLNGREIGLTHISLSPGKQAVQLNTAELPAGTYLVRIISNRQYLSGKFIRF